MSSDDRLIAASTSMRLRLGVDLPLQEPAEPALVLCLDLRFHPVSSGHGPTTAGARAVALDFIVPVVGGGPVVRQLLAGRDVAHRHEDDLPLDRDVGIAGMVGVEHGA